MVYVLLFIIIYLLTNGCNKCEQDYSWTKEDQEYWDERFPESESAKEERLTEAWLNLYWWVAIFALVIWGIWALKCRIDTVNFLNIPR